MKIAVALLLGFVIMEGGFWSVAKVAASPSSSNVSANLHGIIVTGNLGPFLIPQRKNKFKKML